MTAGRFYIEEGRKAQGSGRLVSYGCAVIRSIHFAGIGHGEGSETGGQARRGKKTEGRRQEAEIRGQRPNVRGQGRFIRKLEN